MDIKKIVFTVFFFISVFVVHSQTIFGIWENKDEKTGKVDSVIEVYEEDGRAYAKIIEIAAKDQQKAICDKCNGSRKNKPILGMNILGGLKKDGNQWSGGKILDPKNGKEYQCYIKLKGAKKLKIRGFVGFAAFGRTVYWYRK